MTEENSLLNVVRTLSIVLIAICAGILVFAVLAVTLRPMDGAGNWSVLVVTGLGLTAVALVMRVVLPPLVVRGKLQEIAKQDGQRDQADLAAAYLTSGIVGNAMLDGAGILNVLVYWLERNPVNLGAAAIVVAAVLAGLPRLHRAADWIEDRQAELRELRAAR